MYMTNKASVFTIQRSPIGNELFHIEVEGHQVSVAMEYRDAYESVVSLASEHSRTLPVHEYNPRTNLHQPLKFVQVIEEGNNKIIVAYLQDGSYIDLFETDRDYIFNFNFCLTGYAVLAHCINLNKIEEETFILSSRNYI